MRTVIADDVSDEAYIFNSENPKLKLVVHESAMQRTIDWESSPDKAETNFDKLLGQNGELVEERKKQVLAGALGIVQCHYKETPNKMEVVAALFGKKLGEEFLVELTDDYSARCYRGRIWRVKLTPAGLKYFVPNEGWFINRPILSDLLTDGAVIVDE